MATYIVPLVAGATLKAGDAVFTVSKGGVGVDLTGATVKWHRRHVLSLPDLAEETQTMTVLPPVAPAIYPSKCTPTYSAAASKLLTRGDHICEIEATLASNEVVKIDGIILRVREGLRPAVP